MSLRELLDLLPLLQDVVQPGLPLGGGGGVLWRGDGDLLLYEKYWECSLVVLVPVDLCRPGIAQMHTFLLFNLAFFSNQRVVASSHTQSGGALEGYLV